MPAEEPNLLTTEAWAQVWKDFRKSAFRLETRDEYRVGEENEATVRKFLETGELDDNTRWHDQIRAWREAGKTIGRVHTMTSPLSDYLRYEFAAYEGSAEAGEDIRILDYAITPDPGLPAQDFWVFDEEIVVLMHYDEHGTYLGSELADVDVAEYLRYRDLAVAHSVLLADYEEPATG